VTLKSTLGIGGNEEEAGDEAVSFEERRFTLTGDDGKDEQHRLFYPLVPDPRNGSRSLHIRRLTARSATLLLSARMILSGYRSRATFLAMDARSTVQPDASMCREAALLRSLAESARPEERLWCR